MNRVIALNSGGFDSVVMLHRLVIEDNKDVLSLFFNYGQRNSEKERECARKVANNLGLEHIEIDLPPINWSHSSLYDSTEDSMNQYIEMRNLIFISYATSLAESRGIRDIYLAYVNPEGQYYLDCSPRFVDALNDFLSVVNMEIHTPLIDFTKEELVYDIRFFGLKRDDFFTCNTPKEEEGNLVPCGECSDCQALEMMFEYADNYRLLDLYINEGVQEEFKDLFMKTPITSAKLAINNKCQFTCTHCLYNGHKKLKRDNLTIDQWKKVIDDLAEIGVTDVDFFGKEPLIDDKVFELMDHIDKNHPNMTYMMITNGANIPKYLDFVVKYLKKVTLSVEDLEEVKLRTSPITENISLLVKNGVEVQISLDLTPHNIDHVEDIVKELYKLGIRDIYVKPLVPIGGQYDEQPLDWIIPPIDKIPKAMNTLAFMKGYEDLNMTFELKKGHLYLLRENAEFREIYDNFLLNRTNIYNRLVLDIEHYCGRYESSIFILSDGHVLGCGFELASDVYDKLSSGNVLDTPLNDIVKLGKTKALKLIENTSDRYGCYHTKKFYF